MLNVNICTASVRKLQFPSAKLDSRGEPTLIIHHVYERKVEDTGELPFSFLSVSGDPHIIFVIIHPVDFELHNHVFLSKNSTVTMDKVHAVYVVGGY